MNKILTSKQIQQVDRYTIEHEPIASIDLMERASKRFYKRLKKIAGKSLYKNPVHVVVGTGNNGGDGLVVARFLKEDGADVRISIVQLSEQGSPDFETNKERAIELGIPIHSIQASEDVPDFNSEDLVIDAIFGTGLSRPAEGIAGETIQKINAASPIVVSVDIPSGLYGEDNSENLKDNIVRADYTITFQVPKLSFFFAENEIFLGRWYVEDIGLHPDGIQEQESNYYFIDQRLIQSLHRDRRAFAHKGSFGHALIVAGSYGMTGAAVLSANACSRSGCGLTTIYAPKSAYTILQSTIPEAMCIADENEQFITAPPKQLDYTCIGIGPGMGTDEQTAKALKLFIQNSPCPLVLDADALNILSENPTWMAYLPEGSILTPHPGEFARLIGSKAVGYENIRHQIALSVKHRVYIVLKGAYTSISSPDGNVFFNTTGNPGMATGGSGDVLTGLLSGLRASGYSSLETVLMGVYLHGLAGDLALKKQSMESLRARDLVEYFGKAFQEISG